MSSKLIKNTFNWVLLLLLYGCSVQQLNSPNPKVLKLLPPEEGLGNTLIKQKVTIESRGRRQQFLLVARFDQKHLKLVVLLPAGQQLLSLDYDGEKLVQEKLPSVEIPGREILASMQIALWPEHSIKKHYTEKDGWRVEITPRERILLTTTGVLLKIKRHAEKLVVDNYLHDYRVIIQPLENAD